MIDSRYPAPLLERSHPLSRFDFSKGWPKSETISKRAQSLQRIASERNTSVEYIGTMPLFSGHRVAQGSLYDWVLVSAEDDPLFSHSGGFPIPDHAKADLETIRDAGIEFDMIYIAHEVQPGSVEPDRPLTIDALRPPPPRSVQKLSHGLGSKASAFWSGGLTPMKATPFLIGTAALGAVAALPVVAGAAAALPALLVVDPIVLGVIASPSGSAHAGDEAGWFYLTHWDYGAD